MMKEIDFSNAILIHLETLPNQSLTIRLANSRYEIKLITISDSLMAITISRDDVVLIQNKRLIPSVSLLAQHNAKGHGNFVFITPDETYPYYTEFNNGHELYFIPEG
ncbi:phage baseplate plug family protein [Klebsiella oxytoca]|uniref:phage baseplate plug family protein n=1 Tax=Klebsiella oxytoca TaxID=571 RepID=UPI0039C9EA20